MDGTGLLLMSLLCRRHALRRKGVSIEKLGFFLDKTE